MEPIALRLEAIYKERFQVDFIVWFHDSIILERREIHINRDASVLGDLPWEPSIESIHVGSNLLAMAPNLLAMAPNLLAMASNHDEILWP